MCASQAETESDSVLGSVNSVWVFPLHCEDLACQNESLSTFVSRLTNRQSTINFSNYALSANDSVTASFRSTPTTASQALLHAFELLRMRIAADLGGEPRRLPVVILP